MKPVTFILLFCLVVLSLPLTGCLDDLTPTPPVTGPANEENEPEPTPASPSPDSDPITAAPDELTSNVATIAINNASDSTDFTLADAIMMSNDGAFTPGSLVTVGIVATQSHAPEVASLDDTTVFGTIIRLPADELGAVEFGVYTNAQTTPGSYTFFAEQGNKRLTIEIEVVLED